MYSSTFLTVINDRHIGAVRAGGTTPVTAWQLRQDLLNHLERDLNNINSDLCILGDLLDDYSCPLFDLFQLSQLLTDWLGKNPTSSLYLVAGNHDLAKNSTVMSSFQFLAKMLSAQSDRAHLVLEPVLLKGLNAYIIPHLPNQELFNLALTQVPTEAKYVLLHCNFDNNFADEKDHSLNLSREQAQSLKDKGVQHIILAHEHQQKTAMDGLIQIIGNQDPASVADCLGNVDKRYLLLKQEQELQYVRCWHAVGDFIEMDWRQLSLTSHRFVRVVGEAASTEAATMFDTIAKFRSRSSSLVISNAVKIEGQNNAEERQVSLEQIKGFSVKEVLLSLLKPENAQYLKTFLEKHNA